MIDAKRIPMISGVELHDSTLTGITEIGSGAEIQFRPAYVHNAGSGWTQDIDLVISEGTVESVPMQLPCDLSDGSLSVGATTWSNLLPPILDELGVVLFTAETAFGERLVVRGSRVRLITRGDPCFVERVDLPDVSLGYNEGDGSAN